MIAVKTFTELCNSGMHIIKYDLLCRMVEDIRRFEEQSALNKSSY